MTPATCPDCGRPLPTGRTDGLCPACLLRLGEDVEGGETGSTDENFAPASPDDAAPQAPRTGRYQLIEIIGEGGFGTVWMAAQTEPVRRQVALKVIKLGMDTRQVVARFEGERQALAMVDHPNIARVFDGGMTEPGKFEFRSAKCEGSPKSEATSKSEISNQQSELPSGRPYFVMELVRGLPITEFCHTRQLTTRERIELFIPVCQAVQHAHQKGVIHRDLKPSNILVTEQDGRGVPKVIDFGVAKAIEEPLTDKTLFTRFHQFLGTPAYMSPEQTGFGGLDVDTRSDIYSLGVLLYELLTGLPPLDLSQARDASHEAILKIIREVEPLRPSTQLRRTLSAPQTAKPVPSRVPPQASRIPRHGPRLTDHTSRIDPDLDWIILKALEKDRSRRYETANGLAADLRRYLDDEPIAARPPSTIYRLQKLARRNKLGFAAGGAVVVALIAGLVTTWWQARRAERHLELERLNVYVSGMNAAHQAIALNDYASAVELLDRLRPGRGETDFRGFEWRHLWHRCQHCLVSPKEVFEQRAFGGIQEAFSLLACHFAHGFRAARQARFSPGAGIFYRRDEFDLPLRTNPKAASLTAGQPPRLAAGAARSRPAGGGVSPATGRVAAGKSRKKRRPSADNLEESWPSRCSPVNYSGDIRLFQPDPRAGDLTRRKNGRHG